MLKHIALTIALALFVSFYPTATQATSSVWKVEKDGATIYLGGTIHMLRKSDFPLPKEFSQAYDASDSLVFETDILSLNSSAFVKDMILELSYKGDKTIASVLPPETYQRLESYAAQYGISLDFYRKAKPGLLMSTLTIFELQKLGVTEHGVDMHFAERAATDNKPSIFLETVPQQIQFLAELGVGNEEVFYQNLLREMDAVDEVFIKMIAAWQSGNSKALEDLAVAPMKTSFPSMHQSLLVDRNNNWLPAIESFFENEPVEFVLVGAAHLLGVEGVIEQLKKRGYQITQL